MFTSYYGNIKNLPKDLILVSISRSCPDIDGIHKFTELAPSQDLLNRYKSGKCSKGVYIREYLEQLSKYRPEQWLVRIINFLLSDGVKTVEVNKLCFLCYEKYLDGDSVVFCHRHIFANYMNSVYDIKEYSRLSCRIIIAGTRNADSLSTNKEVCFRCIKYGIIKLKRLYPEITLQDIEIVQGGAKGADKFGKQFARKFGISSKQFDANWEQFGKSAGYKRNVEMAEYTSVADITMLIAFPAKDTESKGTYHMIDIAREYGFNHILIMGIDTIPFK